MDGANLAILLDLAFPQFVRKIEGGSDSVMGLPLGMLEELLLGKIRPFL